MQESATTILNRAVGIQQMQASGDDLPAARLAGYRYGNRADAPVAASRPVDTGLLPEAAALRSN